MNYLMIKKQKCSVIDVAHYIVDIYTRENKPVPLMHLQFIIYFVFGEYYKITGKELFDENIYLDVYGISIPEVFDEYRWNGITPICDLYSNIAINKETKNIIYPIIKKYREYDEWRLYDKIKETGGLWDRNYKGYRELVSHFLIYKYFKGMD